MSRNQITKEFARIEKHRPTQIIDQRDTLHTRDAQAITELTDVSAVNYFNNQAIVASSIDFDVLKRIPSFAAAAV